MSTHLIQLTNVKFHLNRAKDTFEAERNIAEKQIMKTQELLKVINEALRHTEEAIKEASREPS